IKLVADGRLSTGHAKAMASLTGPAALALANEVVALGLSVRATEERARIPASAESKKRPRAVTIPSQPNAAVKGIENDLRRRLQTDVELQMGPDAKGKLKISFYSQDDLERLIDLLLP